jgi:myo-inositol-1(or 4)-monophosphatase
MTVISRSGQAPDPPSATALLHLAMNAATAAGTELLRRQGSAGSVDYKSSATDPVSDADRASERLLATHLLGARSDDGLSAEEGTIHRGSSGLRWIVDPLDGTVNYLYGLPGWCISVACEQLGHGDTWQSLLGVVHDPVRDETFTAVRGQGARMGLRDLRVNDPVPLAQALIATGFGYQSDQRSRQAAVVARLLPKVRDIRRIGSTALELSWLAAGRVDGYYEDEISNWDWAAGLVIAAEAGATVTPWGSGVVAAGPALHPPLISELGPAPCAH